MSSSSILVTLNALRLNLTGRRGEDSAASVTRDRRDGFAAAKLSGRLS
jgi:hypothetical protein